jgi:hypothetical protein
MLEVALAKPVKHSNKFIVKSFGLSVVKKVIAATVMIADKKTHFASVGGNNVIQASTHALDLHGLGSSVSDDETKPRELPCKRPRNFLLPKGVPKPSVMGGNFE